MATVYTSKSDRAEFADMVAVFEKCGLTLKNDYSWNDALTCSGISILGVLDSGYPALLKVLAAQTQAGNPVCDKVLSYKDEVPATEKFIRRMLDDAFALTDEKLPVTGLSVKYSFRHSPAQFVSKYLNECKITLKLDNDECVWSIRSETPMKASDLPQLKKLRMRDTLIISPSDKYRMELSSVAILENIFYEMKDLWKDRHPYFYENGGNVYVLFCTDETLAKIKELTGLSFFPFSQPQSIMFNDVDSMMADTAEAADESTKVPDAETADSTDIADEILPIADEAAADEFVPAEFSSDEDTYVPVAEELDSYALAKDRETEEALLDDTEDSADNGKQRKEFWKNLLEDLTESAHRLVMLPSQREKLRNDEYDEMRDMLLRLGQRGLQLNKGSSLREIVLREGIKPGKLLRKKWEGMLWFLCGTDKQNGEMKHYCNDILLFDERDAYAPDVLIELTKLIQAMTDDALHFGSMRQRTDDDGYPTAFEFVQDGKKHGWRIHSSRSGEKLTEYFENMAKLMRASGCTGNLWYYEVNEKCYYMYVTNRNGLRLRKLTGLSLQPVLRE